MPVCFAVCMEVLPGAAPHLGEPCGEGLMWVRHASLPSSSIVSAASVSRPVAHLLEELAGAVSDDALFAIYLWLSTFGINVTVLPWFLKCLSQRWRLSPA